VLSGHARHAWQRYNAELAIPASTTDFLSRKTRKVSETRKVLQYTISQRSTKLTGKNYRQQAYLTIKALIELGAVNGVGKSVREIQEAAKRHAKQRSQPATPLGRFLPGLIAAGIVTCVNPEDARQKKQQPKELQPGCSKTGHTSKEEKRSKQHNN
jgi:hypothetical protein